MEELARPPRRVTSVRIDRTTPASRVIEAFGGLTRFCEACDWPLSTVHSWLSRGLVPARWRDGVSYQSYIIARAREQGIDLPVVFFIERDDAAEPVCDG